MKKEEEMTKIDYLIDELCPNGVKFEELRNKNLFKFYYGKGNKIPEDIVTSLVNPSLVALLILGIVFLK